MVKNITQNNKKIGRLGPIYLQVRPRYGSRFDSAPPVSLTKWRIPADSRRAGFLISTQSKSVSKYFCFY